MENQLIVYTPKKNVKKIVLIIFLGFFISMTVFTVSFVSSAAISSKSKWNQTKDVNIKLNNSALTK